MSKAFDPQDIPFPTLAKQALANTQLRRNLQHATTHIRAKRAQVVGELPDWDTLREAGHALKQRVLRHLDTYLLQLESSVQRVGGTVHWARDAQEANRIVADIAQTHGVSEVVKVKSLTTDEIGLNDALAQANIQAIETDLAELIIQLADEPSSHILVPAIHKSRAEIRDIFLRSLDVQELSDEPAELAGAARTHLRSKFLETKVGISGANFAVAESGTISIFESEGNGRMCTTLPDVLVTVMGIEKVIPTWQDVEILLQLLPRSSTGERMNPYTIFWSGITPNDGPQEFHLILLDNGRTQTLADPVGREALACIRCSACLNVCPVYERTGGHAYNSVYPGPIGAILTPQLHSLQHAQSLPYASTLCSACYDVCPVKIPIPDILLHLRGRLVRQQQTSKPIKYDAKQAENLAMKLLTYVFSSRGRYERMQKLAQLAQVPLVRDGFIEQLPGPLAGWSTMRDMPALPGETFREWWRKNRS